MQHNCDFGWN